MKKRKRKEVKFRHSISRVFFKILLWPAIKIKYRYRYKTYSKLKKTGPYLIIGNHTIAIDPILMSFSFPFHVYYFATEQIFNLGLLSKLLVYLVNPISKSKDNSDISSIKKAKRIVDEGGSIGLFPEGNVTYDGALTTVNESVVKLVRLLKIDILIFTTKGLYLSNPRWSITRKKGKTYGDIVKVIKKEEYDLLSNEELYELIMKSLETNAYLQQEEKLLQFKGKNLASGLERLVFMDLETNIPFVTYSSKNELKSTASDFKLTYDKYGYVTDQTGTKSTLIDINHRVIESYYNYYKNLETNFIFKESVLVEKTTKNEKHNEGTNNLELFKDKIVIHYKDKTEELTFDNINTLVIQGKKKIIINGMENKYLITFDINSSPYKYLLTYQFYKKEINNDNTFNIQQFGL